MEEQQTGPNIEYTDEWTDDQIAVAKITEKKAKAFNWLHHQSFLYYSRWNDFIKILTMVGMFLFGSTGIIVLFVGVSEQTIKIVQTVFNAIFIFFSILSIIFQILDPIKKAVLHNDYATDNSNLYVRLREDLCELITHEQINNLLKDVLKLEIHMRDNAPDIPSWVWKKYYKTFGSNALKKDTLLGSQDLEIEPTRKTSKHIRMVPDDVIVEMIPISQNDTVTNRIQTNTKKEYLDFLKKKVAKTKAFNEDLDYERELEQRAIKLYKMNIVNEANEKANETDINVEIEKVKKYVKDHTSEEGTPRNSKKNKNLRKTKKYRPNLRLTTIKPVQESFEIPLESFHGESLHNSQQNQSAYRKASILPSDPKQRYELERYLHEHNAIRDSAIPESRKSSSENNMAESSITELSKTSDKDKENL